MHWTSKNSLARDTMAAGRCKCKGNFKSNLKYSVIYQTKAAAKGKKP